MRSFKPVVLVPMALLLGFSSGALGQTSAAQPAAPNTPTSLGRLSLALRHTAPPHHATHHAAKKATVRHVPVVSPRHQAPRRAVHPAAPRVEPPAPVAAPPAAPSKPAAPAKPALPADVGTNTGLHLPRFAALKSDEVNMRSGPGERYPVLWTYKRRDLPVQIEREFDVWRLVEDMDGVKGWVHQATLTGRRGFVIVGTEPRTLRVTAADDGVAVALLKPGVIGRLRSCDAGADWCQASVGDYRGWLKRSDFWGTSANEAVQP